MDILAVIQQLKANAIYFAGNVAGAADMESALDKGVTITYPWAYVIPMGEEADPNTSMDSYDQDIWEKFAVIVVLDNAKNPSDRRGQASAVQFSVAKQSPRGALVYGWNPQPERAARGIEYAGMDLVRQDMARAVYEFRFRQQVHITEEDGFISPGDELTDITVNIDGVSSNTSGRTPVSGANPTTLVAGPSGVSGHRVLMSDGTGAVIHANPNDPNYLYAGISTGAAAAGQPVSIALDGPMIDPSWLWTSRMPLFVGTDGALTMTPPTTGILQQVAVALSPSTISIDPYPPITLN